MSETFKLPDVGEGLTEAEITSWKVSVGDTVEINDIICEIETAKSLVELPVPYAGTVTELVADEGDTLEVGQPLVRIDAYSGTSRAGAPEDSAPTDHQHQSAPDQRREDPAEPEKPAERSSPETAHPDQALVGSGPKADSTKHRPRVRATALDLVDTTGLEEVEHQNRRGASQGSDIAHVLAKSAPPVRALAKRLGVPLWKLTGSGPGGQITRDDVERQANSHSNQHAVGQASGSSVPQHIGRSTQEFGPGRGSGLLYPGPPEEDVEVRGVRKATAQNVSTSASQVPHVSVFKEVDVTATMDLRRALKGQPEYEGLSVSPLLFAAKAIIWAARRHKQVNATWHDTYFTLRNYVHLGIAASTPRGLVVPVIADAHTLNTHELATAITQLTAEARQGRTTPDQMTGGTVSITNIGSLGLDYGTPILPPGQAAIIALGSVRKKPWIVDGDITARDVMVIGGSFDHRLIDGDVAGAYLSDIAAVLEQPGLLLD